MIIIIFASLFLLVLLAATLTRCWRQAMLIGGIIWGISLLVITELLSAFHVLTFSFLLVAWLFVCIITIVLIVLRRHKLSFEFKKIPITSIIILIAVLGIVGATLVIALNAPPNTVDSMTYHSSRVVHWIQNKSVAHYPTHILRQLFMVPGAEYFVLNFQILSGGDKFANLVQWFSMFGSLVCVSLIAKFFGAKIRGQVFAIAVCATIPMGILQSTSTQTDYAAGFWFINFVYWILKAQKSEKWRDVLLAGGALGLSLFTKQTIYLFALPYVFFFAIFVIKKCKLKLWNQAFAIGFIVVFCNVSQFSRNYKISGNIFGNDMVTCPKIANEKFSFSSLISGLTKNAGLHLATDNKKINDKVLKSIIKIHKVLGINIDDPKLTFNAVANKYKIRKIYDEDYDGNCCHFIVFFFSLLMLIAIGIISRYKHSNENSGFGPLVLYGLSIILTFILLSFIIKWMPFNSRLQLSIFILAAPFIALTLEKTPIPFLGEFVIALLLFFAYPYVVKNSIRPLKGASTVFNVSREKQYFLKSDHLYNPYLIMVSVLSDNNFSKIGLLCDECGTEYPLFMFLKKANPNVRIEHVYISNFSRKKTDFSPEIIIVLNNHLRPPSNFKKCWNYSNISLYIHKNISDLRTKKLKESLKKHYGIDKENLLKNGNFSNKMANWFLWGKAGKFTNSIKIVASNSKYKNTIKIENPHKKLIGISQLVSVKSGTVYRLSGVVKSVTAGTSKNIFGGRIGFYLPPQKEKEIVWMTEHNKWWKQEIVFENKVDGNACVYVHMGYGGVASTGEFTNIKLEKIK